MLTRQPVLPLACLAQSLRKVLPVKIDLLVPKPVACISLRSSCRAHMPLSMANGCMEGLSSRVLCSESKAASKCRYRLCCISLAQEAKGLHGKAIKAVELLLLFRAPGDHLPKGADVFVVWHILHGEGGGP